VLSRGFCRNQWGKNRQTHSRKALPPPRVRLRTDVDAVCVSTPVGHAPIGPELGANCQAPKTTRKKLCGCVVTKFCSLLPSLQPKGASNLTVGGPKTRGDEEADFRRAGEKADEGGSPQSRYRRTGGEANILTLSLPFLFSPWLPPREGEGGLGKTEGGKRRRDLPGLDCGWNSQSLEIVWPRGKPTFRCQAEGGWEGQC